MRTVEAGSVRELWRYPVKSMAGEALAESDIVAEYGLVGDRGWALRDERIGEITSAKKLPALLGLRARYAQAPSGAQTPPVVIRLANGAMLPGFFTFA